MPCGTTRSVAWLASVLATALLVFNAWYFFIARAASPGRTLERLMRGPTDHILDDPQWRSAVEEYEVLNRRYGSRPAIVFLGDSITRDFPLDEYFPSGAADSVILLNRGIHSDTMLGLEQRFERTMANLNVRKLFVMIGTNDLLYRTPDETAARLEALLGRAKYAYICVQSILPTPDRRKPVHENTPAYNRKLEEMCQRHGYVYLDLYSRFRNEHGEMKEDLQVDGVHPNARGHKLWAGIIAPLIDR